MKNWWIAFVFLILLTACATVKPATTEPMQKTTEPAAKQTPTVTMAGNATFKLIQSFAKRSPPSVNGTVKNTGTGTGSVKVIARVYYAKIISSENTAILDDIKPEDEMKFGIPISENAQWTSYDVTLEKIS